MVDAKRAVGSPRSPQRRSRARAGGRGSPEGDRVTAASRIASLHGRQLETGSLCLPLRWPLRRLIAATQTTWFGPHVTPQTFELSLDEGTNASLPSGEREYA